MGQFNKTILRLKRKLLHFATLLCLATLTIGAPQFFNRQLENEIITPEARKNILPVMMALLTLMGSGRPTAEDLNSLMVATRDLKKYLPEGSDISDFIGIEGFEDMALPETGDVIQYVNREPVLMTNFGKFPLSAIEPLTNEERQQFIPPTRKLTNLLQKENLDANQMKNLVKTLKKLTNLIPTTFIN